DWLREPFESLEGGEHVLPGIEGAEADMPFAATAEAGPRSADDARLVEELVKIFPRLAGHLDPDIGRVVAAGAGETEGGDRLPDLPRVFHVEGDEGGDLGLTFGSINRGGGL